MLRRSVLILICLGLGGAARVDRAVDVALVLAVDISSSVDEARFRLQQSGYAAAFRSPLVQAALLSGPKHSIAVAYVQWAGARSQHLVVAWTLIDSEAASQALADRIEASDRLDEGSTSISGAIAFAMDLLASAPYGAERRIIDVSGDGSNNSGRMAHLARDEAVAAGITINGLLILAVEPELDRYYRENVIGGPGAFLVSATSFATFATAIANKLVREVAAVRGPAPG
ncbi:MAG TPA: DUF1194 domain-containing protein [Aliidongia sp.]|uniref:DUF1194 domain-containing protein n=1 Tax=Aliidongia sp. TaxID=1914230 RepID=UPI002DDD9D76|nr:DUF1194 domain-containing protein [Aliidongia sp.]HEV2674958.1 DUF1194 domain-containing protein [Aliidongia sp.]